MKNNEHSDYIFLTPSLEMKNKISTTKNHTSDYSLKVVTLDFSISSEGVMIFIVASFLKNLSWVKNA